MRFVASPELDVMAPKAGRPAYFLAYLTSRYVEGVTLVRLLFGEIQQAWFNRLPRSDLARFISLWKNAARPIAVAVEAPPAPSPPRPTEPRPIRAGAGANTGPHERSFDFATDRGGVWQEAKLRIDFSRQISIVDALEGGVGWSLPRLRQLWP